MAIYYVNKKPQENGDHEVHKEGCTFMPNEKNRIFLGPFDNCHDAVQAAKTHFPLTADGCYYCSNECHTR